MIFNFFHIFLLKCECQHGHYLSDYLDITLPVPYLSASRSIALSSPPGLPLTNTGCHKRGKMKHGLIQIPGHLMTPKYSHQMP